VAEHNALRKALAAASAAGADGPVLGVDTVVATGAELWGKPADADAARATLRRLSGRTHVVVSGVAVVEGGEVRHAFSATTDVTFRTLGDELLEWYVATGEWRERAGGYAIQGRGAALVTAIAGDYLNVVGLPVAALLDAWPELLAIRR
jgi:septum formation protein